MNSRCLLVSTIAVLQQVILWHTPVLAGHSLGEAKVSKLAELQSSSF